YPGLAACRPRAPGAVTGSVGSGSAAQSGCSCCIGQAFGVGLGVGLGVDDPPVSTGGMRTSPVSGLGNTAGGSGESGSTGAAAGGAGAGAVPAVVGALPGARCLAAASSAGAGKAMA